MTNFKKVVRIAVAGLVFLAQTQIVSAVNNIPLKPDSANSAPLTVFGSPNNGVSIGKTTAPNTALDVVGNVTVSGSIISKGSAPARTSISLIQTSSAIIVTTSYESVLSTGGPITLTATPTISTTVFSDGTAIPDGFVLTLISTSTSGTVTLQDNGTLSGSLIELGAATRTLTLNKILALRYVSDNGHWIEEYYGNN